MITSNHSGITGPITSGYSEMINGGIGLYTNTNNTVLTTTLSQAITNSNNMVKQTKVAVFTVERNDKNEVKSSKFVKEFWVEVKNGGSVVLAAAKQLDKDYDPDTTVIREIHICNF
jgi:hypothetical protein